MDLGVKLLRGAFCCGPKVTNEHQLIDTKGNFIVESLILFNQLSWSSGVVVLFCHLITTVVAAAFDAQRRLRSHCQNNGPPPVSVSDVVIVIVVALTEAVAKVLFSL